MTPRTPQCEVFFPLLSNSKHSGVPEDSKSPTLGVGVSSSHFTQSGVATKIKEKKTCTHGTKNIYSNNKRKFKNYQNEAPKLLANPNPFTHHQNPQKASPNTLPLAFNLNTIQEVDNHF